AAELAFHWERAGDAARAAADLVRAARAALSTFANADAEAYATRALALAQDDATRLAAHLAREEARRRIGDRAGQREDLAAARALARDDDARHDVGVARARPPGEGCVPRLARPVRSGARNARRGAEARRRRRVRRRRDGV